MRNVLNINLLLCMSNDGIAKTKLIPDLSPEALTKEFS